jgi:endonuclease YncB( thermonuclease family)
MLRNIFFIIIGFILGIFLTSSLSWRDIDWENLRQTPIQELMRLRGIITERPKIITTSGTVTKVLSGDKVIIEGGQEVQLLGITADEEGEPCYTIAKNRLQDLVLLQRVTLVKDVNNTDPFGRWLRYIKFKDENIDVKMVQEGLVSLKINDSVTIYKNDLVFAEQYAKNKGDGCKWRTKY